MVLKKSTARLKLPETNAGTLADLVSAAADLTVVLDGDDVIDDLSHHLGDLSSSPISAWRGRAIEDVVLRSSRTRLRTMLNAAREGKTARGFDIAHLLDDGSELPVQYSAFRVGNDGQMVLVGRDLRAVADLQSRLVANRQSLEQNRKRQRQSEAHYRLLFETASDAMVIVDGRSGRIREANPRAAAMLESAGPNLGGRKLSSIFERSRQAEIQAMLSHVMTAGTPTTLATVMTGRGRALSLFAELFRAGDLKLVLLRISSPDDEVDIDAADFGLGDLVRNATEAVLVTDEDGTALWANESFLALAGIALAAQAVGRPLDAFFRWHGIEEDVLLANVRRHGRVPTVSATLRGANGQTSEVELSAIARSDGARAGYAFVMRARSQEPSAPGRNGDPLARTVDNLAELVGRVPMRDMVRDTTDVIERMCIEAALKLTGNNRASAARVLGLSRQALYLKMNRFGIADGE